MADDTRQNTQPVADTGTPSSPSEIDQTQHRRPRPKHDFPKSQASKMWDAFGNPSDPVNAMPGGMINSAGGRPKEVSWRDAFSAFTHQSDNPNAPAFYQTGCARDALLVGIGTGGGAGGLHFIGRGLSNVVMTTNVAVGAFAITALGMYTWCTRRQREEARGIAAAVSGMKMLHEKRAREKKVADDAAAALAVQQKQEEEERHRNKSWYKFW